VDPFYNIVLDLLRFRRTIVVDHYRTRIKKSKL